MISIRPSGSSYTRIGGIPVIDLPYWRICWWSFQGSAPAERLGGSRSSPGRTCCIASLTAGYHSGGRYALQFHAKGIFQDVWHDLDFIGEGGTRFESWPLFFPFPPFPSLPFSEPFLLRRLTSHSGSFPVHSAIGSPQQGGRAAIDSPSVQTQNERDPASIALRAAAEVNMTHWEVQLTGDSADLEILAVGLSALEFEVARSGADYVLRSSHFEAAVSADSIREQAEKLIRAISGAARLCLKTEVSLALGAVIRVEEDGRRDIFMFCETGHLRIRGIPLTWSITRADGSSEMHRPTDPMAAWVAAAVRDGAVAKALRLRNAAPLEWVDLYRLFEVVEADAGAKMHELDWISQAESKLFTRTANSVAAIGDKARHGKESTKPPPQPMALITACELVDRLLRRWLDGKSINVCQNGVLPRLPNE